MGDIKVSVIIPVFNTEKYLNECIESIISQTLKEIEIICIDDGSTDASPQILKAYAAKDDRICIISQSNKGAGAARNEGIKRACGKYVMFMDADDYYPDKDVIELLYHAAEDNNVYIAGGEFSLIEPDGSIRTDFADDEFLYGYEFEKEGIINYREYQFDYGYTRFIYNNEFLNFHRLYFPDLRRFQDPPFFVSAMYQAGNFFALKKATYIYRVGHKVMNWNNRAIIDVLKGLIMNLEFAEKEKLDMLYELTMKRICQEYRYSLYEVINRLEISEVYKNSISYRVGAMVTFVPRRIIHFFADIFN